MHYFYVMKRQRIRYRRFHRLGWLLAAILTFGFIASAGQVAESYASHRQSVKVERTLSAENFGDAKALELAKKWNFSVPVYSGPKPDAQVLRKTSIHHNHQASVALTARSSEIANIELFVPFISDHSIGHRSDRDSSNLPAG